MKAGPVIEFHHPGLPPDGFHSSFWSFLVQSLGECALKTPWCFETSFSVAPPFASLCSPRVTAHFYHLFVMLHMNRMHRRKEKHVFPTERHNLLRPHVADGLCASALGAESQMREKFAAWSLGICDSPRRRPWPGGGRLGESSLTFGVCRGFAQIRSISRRSDCYLS